MGGSLPEVLLNELPDAVLVVDEAGFAQFANKVAQQLFGAEIVGKQVGVPVEDFAVLQLPRRSGLLTVELRVADASEWRAGCRAVVLRDVTERHQLRRDLQERVFELDRLAVLLDAAPVPIARVLDSGVVTWCNQAFADAFDGTGSLQDILPVAAAPEALKSLLAGGLAQTEPDAEARDARIRSAVLDPDGPNGVPLMVSAVPLAVSGSGRHDSGIVITYGGGEENLLTDYLRAAFYDSETGIPNHRGLGLQIEHDWTVRPGQRAVLVIGFQAVDRKDQSELIRRLVPAAQMAVQEVQREGLPLVGSGLHEMRMGRLDSGTLGVVLTVDPGAGTDLALLAVQIARTLAETSSDRLFVGVVAQADDVSTAFEWGRLAAEAAKEQGEPVHVFEECDSAGVSERTELTLAIREAIANDAFTVVFQPRIDLVTGGLASAEVLARWTHPVLGEIPPNRFVPILRRLGLVSELTRIVAQKALEQAQAWAAEGRQPVKLSLNIVPDDLTNRRVLDLIRGLSEQLGEGRALELELAEQDSFTFRTHERLRALLDDLGIELSLDDFGTGYSTFRYLATLPISCIKVDKSFADDLLVSEHHDAAAAMYRSIVALGHEIGILVCAEGVESHQQVEELRALEVDEVQGYVFSRPLRAAEFAAAYPT